jgi:hypothetical protein
LTSSINLSAVQRVETCAIFLTDPNFSNFPSSASYLANGC